MSAWKTGSAHNQYVAEIICKFKPELESLSVRNLVQTLNFYNALSLLRRYDEPIVIDPDHEIKIDPTWLEQSREMAAALGCYDYQTCEFYGWEHTEIYKWITEIHDRLNKLASGPYVAGSTYWGLEAEQLVQPYTPKES